MDIINDTKLTVGWFVNRIHPFARSATFLVKGTFRLAPDGIATPNNEQDELKGDTPDSAGNLHYPSDFAWFKPRTDLCLQGSCHVPAKDPSEVCEVGFQLDSWFKSLVVLGPRKQTRKWKIFSAASDPEPFRSMKLGYDRSFGGEKYPLNPSGKGHGSSELPNILDPDELVINPETRPHPAGFAPLPPEWPQRKKSMGTYGARWQKERWPGYPANYDWAMQNAAPPDQQLADYLSGNEKVQFRNLHPDHAVYTSQLPGLRPRWFVREEKAREIPLFLDTLWIDMEEEKLVLLWRGVAEIETLKMKEISEQFIFTEKAVEPPQSEEECNALWSRRKEEIEAEKNPPEPEKEPDEPGPDILPDDETKKPSDKPEKKLAEIGALIEERLNPGTEAEKAQREKLITDMMKKVESGEIPLQEPVDSLKQLSDGFEKAKALHPKLLEGADNPAVFLSALQQPPEFPKPKEEEPLPSPAEPEPKPKWSRERVESHTGPFDREDLGELDLSGVDLAGRSFRETILTKTNLAGANLAGSDLTGATLSEADLSNADLRKSTLDLADFSEAKLTGAKLKEARLNRTTFEKGDLSGADLSHCSGKAASFLGANLSRTNLSESDLPRANFTDAIVDEADFRKASLENGTVHNTVGKAVVMEEANLAKLRTDDKTSFVGGNFRNVTAPRSNWTGATLDDADFTGADLFRSNFSEASLRNTRLSKTDMRSARLAGANLEKAHLLKSNLFQADFEGADLTETDLRGSNLFEAEFLDAKLRDTALDLANVKGTKLA